MAKEKRIPPKNKNSKVKGHKKTHKARRIFIFIIILALLGLYSVMWVGAFGNPFKYNSMQSKKAGTENWMSKIEGSKSLSQINIPGTHDSATKNISPAWFLKDQNSTIKTQLKNGYRYLDIRVKLNKTEDTLLLCHNIGSCRTSIWPWSKKITLPQLVADVKEFLLANPEETVILCIKPEKTSDNERTIVSLIQKLVNEDSGLWYTKNYIPVLENVRGKIVLARRYNVDSGMALGLNLKWKEQGQLEMVEFPAEESAINVLQKLQVQDRFKYSVEDKWQAFHDTINEYPSDSITLVLNFLTTMEGRMLPHPKKYADQLNKKFLELNSLPPTSGILIFDWADIELAKKVIDSNNNK